MTSIFKATSLSAGTQFVAMLAQFLRNLVLARMLSPHDYGVALTFGVVLMVLENIGNFGHDNLILRARYGDSRLFQATLHSTLLIRGFVVAALVLSVSSFIPEYLQLEELEFNYAWLALIPIVNGFTHTDYRRVQRNQEYKPIAMITVISEFASLGIAVTVGYFYHTYWAFYFALVFRNGGIVLSSHLLALRPYVLKFNRKYLNEIISYGWPVIAVGVMVMLGQQADRVIVARQIEIESFATYMLIFLVAGNAGSFVSNTVSGILMRKLSLSSQGRSYLYDVQRTGVITLYFYVPTMLYIGLCGEQLVPLLFGDVYKPEYFFFPIVCSLIGFRVLNVWLQQVSISFATTRTLLMSSIVRLISLILAVSSVYWVVDVRLIAGCFIIGEMLYFFVLSTRLNGLKEGILEPLIGCFLRLFVFTVVLLLVYKVFASSYLLHNFLISSVALLVVVLLSYLFDATFKTLVNKVVRDGRLALQA